MTEQRLRVGVLCDYAEEGWPSMDLVADMLVEHLRSGHAERVSVEQIRPPMPLRLSRLLGGGRRALNADRLYGRLVDYPRRARRLRGHDVYHLVDHSYAQLVHALPAGRAVVTCHDLDTFRCLLEPQREPRSAPFRWMTRRVLDGLVRAARVVCVSETTREALLAAAIVPEGRVRVVANGVHPSCSPLPDPAADQALARRMGPPTGTAVELLSVGSNIARKRLDVLLRVFAELWRGDPRLRLVRVGTPFDGEQAALARELGVDGAVVSLPFLDRPSLAAAYRRAAMVLQTSEREGFGLPVAESMACGTPVVASDIAVLREVGGDAPTYVPVGDVAAWSAAVRRLLEERERDPARWAARREASIARAARFSWAENAREMVEIYRQVASDNN